MSSLVTKSYSTAGRNGYSIDMPEEPTEPDAPVEAGDPSPGPGTLLESVVDELPIGVYRATSDGLIEVNDAFLDIFDAGSREEILGQPVGDRYVDPDVRVELTEALDPGEVVRDREVRMRTLGDATRWVLTTVTRRGSASPSSSGSPAHTTGGCR
jgi:PAS domain-containing protein